MNCFWLRTSWRLVNSFLFRFDKSVHFCKSKSITEAKKDINNSMPLLGKISDSGIITIYFIEVLLFMCERCTWICFKGEWFYTSKSVYRCWRILMHMWQKSCRKQVVSPEGAMRSLINCLKWCHLSHGQLGLKTASLKMKMLWWCGVRKTWAYRASVPLPLLLEAGESRLHRGGYSNFTQW